MNSFKGSQVNICTGSGNAIGCQDDSASASTIDALFPDGMLPGELDLTEHFALLTSKVKHLVGFSVSSEMAACSDVI
ncbi:hypothetical protein Dsin_014005 [Dipteronia sinensis]|uniref:Uncharacterized protein n=1 Tax=Dipteronia sinensis TaxID=43782 RepID=A0AAE0AM05_9ROSI|nr:hypothetical protein Dsin_014005 [Dipteronia sinensis]